jgi:serine/threonine-protein kinase
VGPYDILGKLGGGGMATVYLGRRADKTHELAAVKVMLADLAKNSEFVEMFADEASLLKRLDHPNIPRTLESGTGDHLGYIAMELLTGRTLADTWEAARAVDHAFRYDLAAWICAEVARGLDYAHDLTSEHGEPLHLIHRDVNPSNIFLGYDGRVKLFDFGLAKARGRTAQTKNGIVKGKVAYLSPEQITQLPLDRRSDIFSLGTTLWETTTLSRLFKRDTDIETIRAIRDAEVPDPGAIVSGYPQDLWKIGRRALAIDRDERYATAAELAQDLDAFIARQGVAAGETSAFVAGLLERLFPGERAKQADWLASVATGPTIKSAETMAPPAPIPSLPAMRIDASVPLELVRRKKT